MAGEAAGYGSRLTFTLNGVSKSTVRISQQPGSRHVESGVPTSWKMQQNADYGADSRIAVDLEVLELLDKSVICRLPNANEVFD